MFLSRLALDLRSPQVRHDLNDLYDLHRTLFRAFPDRLNGGPGRVLFRLDLDRASGAPTVLVQSEKTPDWSDLPRGYAYTAEFKPYEIVVATRQRLVFRLRANPTYKTGTVSRAQRLAGPGRQYGKRLGFIRELDQVAWLRRKGEAGGFRVEGITVVPEGMVHGSKAAGSVRLALSLLSVRFDGLLTVTDPDRFLQTLREGIGPAKGLGFGLLSVASGGREP
jgi:CRISPR system Cascade subunit CasE